ncbi:hypothetical protein Pcinc_007724 [Petrolisthes cinctipes]|uniref:Uncharacterized protein n=1 Tax=Petrolisthes cinctipes TaxID=88211 RepID=A0AAE1G7W4_PETCI|nr:hypothetical protein Pcinc_007724 [Petrolisthes cinctipes]
MEVPEDPWEVFSEEALGYEEKAHRPAPPGEVRQVEDKHIQFTRAGPMDFTLEAATKVLNTTEGSRPSLACYPPNKYRKIYAVSGHELKGKAARLNTDLALALTTKGKEPQVVVQHADMSRLEGVLTCQCEAQNFLFWCFGAFYKLLSSLQLEQEEKLLADQLFCSIQLAMVDTGRDSAFALTNVKAMRREAILSHLPPVFKSATKVDQRKSAIDSAILFDEDRVKEALWVADKAATISFQQAAARALVKPRPVTGMPLVERGSRSNTAVDRLPTQLPVGDCLARKLDGWIAIGAEALVLTVLNEGYKIPFATRPPVTFKPVGFRSYSMASEKGKALDLGVQLLLSKGAIEEAPATPGFHSHLFLVTKAIGGFSPILDLSSLNRYVTTTRFRIHPNSRKFLRFIWKGHHFEFKALCFGLSTAPQVFTRMMGPASTVLHQ